MTARTRLLVVAADFSGGGAERELVNLLHRLPHARFEMALCVWRAVYDYSPPGDMPVFVLHKHRAWHVPRTVGRLANVIRHFRPDVVYSQLHYVNLLTGLALRLSGTRAAWVCRLAGNPVAEVRGPILPLARRVLQCADLVAGCSAGVTEAVVEHLRVPARKVTTLPNLVDTAAVVQAAAAPVPACKSPGVYTLVHAGRCSAQKNQLLLLKALSIMRDMPVELWMLGRGPLAPRLRKQVARMGLSSRVVWLGFQNNPFALFRAADCFVLTSDHEGMPNVVIESLLCGTPVVSTRCPYGPEELIDDGKTGLLTPPRDVGALADALRVLADEATRRRMAAAAPLRMAREFALERVYPRYEATLHHGAI